MSIGFAGKQIAFEMTARIFLVNGIRSEQRQRNSDARPEDVNADRSAAMKPLSILDWYRVLRVQHAWTIFQSIRYALWLVR